MIIAGLGDTYEKYDGFRPSDATIQSLIGMPMRAQLTVFRGVELSDDELQPMIDYAIDRFDQNVGLEREFEPAIHALRELHEAGVKTALVTSKNAREIKQFLTRFPATSHVDAVVCASDVERPKPDPESARLACERLGVAPSRAVMIGDSIYDLKCAQGAGVSAFAVAYGAGLRQDLMAENPDHVFETPEEVLEWSRTVIDHRTCLEKS